MKNKTLKDNTSEKEVLSEINQKLLLVMYTSKMFINILVSLKHLDGVNFNANFGEIHAIVGGNGCGKSTLAKVISGVLPIDKGKVSVMGHFPTSPVMARNLGYCNSFPGSNDS